MAADPVNDDHVSVDTTLGELATRTHVDQTVGKATDRIIGALHDAVHRLSIHNANELNRVFPDKNIRPASRAFIAGEED